MAPPVSNPWTTDPNYIDLLKYVIQYAKDAKSPINILKLIRDFKKTSGVAQTENCLEKRIKRMRTRICSFEHIDKESKVKLLFALSAPVDVDFLKKLKKDALVEVDDKKRIKKYESIDGSFKLNGDHSHSAKNSTAKQESKGSLRSLINSYFENKNDSNAVPKNEKEKEMGNLIEFITEKCQNAHSPLGIRQLVKDFHKRYEISQPLENIRFRIGKYCREIYRIEFLDTHTKVKQLFCLSTTVDSEYLEKLRKNALVEVDENNRITHYKANDGSLELRGGHSLSVKTSTGKLESQGSIHSSVIDYFNKKNNADSVAKNEVEKEMRDFIEFITEKCKNVNSPLSIGQLTKDFNQHFGTARSSNCITKRVKRYCSEIQKTEFMDTHSKVRKLFGLSAKLDSDFLKELRKDADVEVDDLNRITKYTANNGSLALHGDHSSSAKRNMVRNEKKNERNTIENYLNSGGNEEMESENENDHSEDENEEFGNEFNSDDENDKLDETDLMGLLNETNNFDNEISIRNRPEMSIDDSFDFELPTERSEEPDLREDDGGKKNDNKNPKRKNSTPTASASAKKRNKGTTGSSSSNWNGSSPVDSMRPDELDDYDTNHSIDDQVNFEPFFGSIQEDLNGILGDEVFQQIQKLIREPQAFDPLTQVLEVPIEHEKPVEIKPETSHNSIIKLFESMQSLILFLNTPSLSWIQTKIHQKIQSIEGQDELIQNNEISLIIQLLIARMTNHSVTDLSKNVESVNLSYFLCYLKAAILNSKMSGVDDLVENISGLIEESQTKRVPMEKVANALLVTLNIDGL